MQSSSKPKRARCRKYPIGLQFLSLFIVTSSHTIQGLSLNSNSSWSCFKIHLQCSSYIPGGSSDRFWLIPLPHLDRRTSAARSSTGITEQAFPWSVLSDRREVDSSPCSRTYWDKPRLAMICATARRFSAFPFAVSFEATGLDVPMAAGNTTR